MRGQKMATNNTSSSGGIGICGMLFILFLALKLTGYITWSWWWVTSPLWIPAGIAIVILLIMITIAVVLCR